MGKKTRKTRWRTLSIEGQSDTESTGGDGAKSHVSKGRWGVPNSNGAHPKYNSSHSTPTHQNKQSSYTHRHRAEFRGHGSYGGPQMRPSGSTRSSSTTSETKITFNEDEYTKITTPRQDVLFKKGYLSKPKPYLQRPLTSAGNSTGDGTPDHQSADGADFLENDLDGFPYPSYGGEVFNPNLYYLNYDVPPTGHPVLFYDQFGRTTVYYPPQLNLPPHSQQSYHPEDAETPKKRYSVDSICESSSPNNETVENETENGEPEVFEGAKAFPGGEIPEATPETTPEVEENDKILGKKPKRRKSLEKDENEKPEKENIILEPETGNTEDIEPEVKENGVLSEVKPEVSVEEEEEVIGDQEMDENTSFSVDAEEFIPRNFVPAYNFVPFIPQEIYPGHFVIIPPPAFFPPVTALHPVHPLTNEEPPDQIDEENIEETVKKEETTEIKEKQGIDIAKIVSKLEEAAREQKIREETEECETKEETSHSKSEETQTDIEENLIDNQKEEIIICKSKMNEQNKETVEPKIETKEVINQVEDRCLKETNERTKEAQKSSHIVNHQTDNKLGAKRPVEPQIRHSVEHSKPQKQVSTEEKIQNIAIKSSSLITTNRTPNHLKISTVEPKSSSVSSEVRITSQNNLKTAQNEPKITEIKPKKTDIYNRYSDRLKTTSSTNKGPKNGFTVHREVPSVSRTVKSRPNAANIQNTPTTPQNAQQKCPRFERSQKTSISTSNTSENNVNNISSQIISNTSGGNAPDQWISVSGKKKRKNIKINLTENVEETKSEVCELPVQNSELPVEPAQPEVVVPTTNLQANEPEVISSPPTVVVEKTKKEKKEKNGPKKVIKKRVIINDAALPESGIIAKDIPSPLPLVEAVGITKIPKDIQDISEEILEKCQEPVLPKIPASPIITKTVAPTSEIKKTKSKKRKNKISSSLDSSISDLNLTNGDMTEILLTNLGPTEDTPEPTDFDTVTLELEKMIQKGLYANLEQKLEKTDSFLANFGGSAPLGGFVGPPKLVNSSLLPFPKIIIPQKSTVNEVNTPEKNTVVSSEKNEVQTKASASNNLSITKAVREWMDKTRETTPEVEIFRKPEELRQEVLNKVLDYENDFIGQLSGVEEEDFQNSDDDVLDEQGIDTSAKDASIVADELSTRSPSVDLLQCWDYDSVAPVVHQEVEPCEEAIEHYESVYGTARDYDRIRNEVIRDNSGNLGSFRPRRGDGGLPYRAICCSVM